MVCDASIVIRIREGRSAPLISIPVLPERSFSSEGPLPRSQRIGGRGPAVLFLLGEDPRQKDILPLRQFTGWRAVYDGLGIF